MPPTDQAVQSGTAKVEIYTRRYCGYCVHAKQLLEDKGVDYVEYAVDAAPELRQEMMRRAPGAYTVPQIFIDGQAIGGCNELYALDRDGELDELLAQSQH